MDKNTPLFCSDLIALKIGHKAVVANLESIRLGGCTLNVENPVAVGSSVSIHCLDCPSGRRRCRNCRFEGTVCGTTPDELGNQIEVEFADRGWRPERWRPRH